MRRVLWLLLGLFIGAGLAGYWARGPLSRLEDVETQLAEVRGQLRGIEGTLAQFPARVDEARVRLRRVARVLDPVDAASRPGHAGLYVATRPGKVFRIDPARGARDPELVLDISKDIDTQGAKPGLGGEAGLLALAFAPGGDRLYVTFTGPGTRDEHSVEWTLVEFRVERSEVDTSSRRELIAVRKKYPHHNGGDIAFGPDGFLYVSIGDGSPFRDLLETGQDTTDFLGSILRIDPRPALGRPYSIPRDNPFVDGDGAPEVWAYGLRNPWRIDFDRVTGDLWIGDVGDHEEEEIDVLRAAEGGGRGANLGWSLVEGTHLRGDEEPEDHVSPLHAYKRRRPFCALIGGFVYRGSAIPALRGAYLFSDYCDGAVRALEIDGNDVADRELDIDVETPSSFAEGPDGEVYVISLKGEVFRIEPA